MVLKTVIASYKKQDGTQRLEIYIYESGKRATISTDYYVRPEHFSKGKVIKHPNADYLNAKMDEIKNKLQRHALKNEGISLKELKAWTAGKAEMTLFGYIDYFIKGIRDKTILIKGSTNRGKPYAYNTVKSIVTSLSYLKMFNPSLEWSDINEDFVGNYTVWMRDKKYKENTITKAIKTLRVLMDRSKKIHKNMDYLDFEASYTDVDSIFLNEDEVEKIMKASIPKRLEGERLRFYLSYNFFLRFGDSITVAKEDLFKENGQLFARLMDQKTKNIRIVPVLPYALKLLEKCNYSLPKSTNQESNRNLKLIGKLAGIDSIHTQVTVKEGKVERLPAAKFNFITTHTARRSIATNLYLSMVKHKNVDLKKLQLMGGWKSVAMLEKYLKIDKLVNAMSAAGDPFFN